MRVMLYFVLIVMLASCVAAMSSDLKPIYDQKETIIIEFTGNIFSPISQEQVLLKRGHVQVPFEYELVKVGDTYYLWGIAPAAENNYTLIIEDVDTTVNGEDSTIDFEQNFSTTALLAQYTVKPGALIATEGFELTLNSNIDEKQFITLDFPQSHEVELLPGENTLFFDIKDLPGGLYRPLVGMYPIVLFSLSKEEPSQTSVFHFKPSSISSVLIIDETPEYEILFTNNGATTLTDVMFEYDSKYFVLTPTKIDSIQAGETISLMLKLKKNSEKIDTSILVTSGNYSVSIPVHLEYVATEEDKQELLNNSNSGTATYMCAELNGKACASGEICSTPTVSTKDVVSCCTATCVPITSDEQSAYNWVGYVLGGILLLIVIYIGIKYYRTKKDNTDPVKKIAKGN